MPVLHMLVAPTLPLQWHQMNQKVFLPKLHAGVQNLGIVKESHSQDTTWPLCIKHFIHMSAQVKLPVKKKIHWKGFIKLLSLHSIQMYNWMECKLSSLMKPFQWIFFFTGSFTRSE